MSESTHCFGRQAALVGVLTPGEGPLAGRRPPAVLLLSAGLVHHVGPNRLYVGLARALARQGHDCFRFDFSGIGDSGPRMDSTPADESAVLETREAMDLLAELRGHRRFVLLGLCSGGFFAFRTAQRDDRVVGLVLLNVRGHLDGEAVDEDLAQRALAASYRRLALAESFRRKNVLKALRLDFDVRGALRSLTERRSRPTGQAVEEVRRGPLTPRDIPGLCIYSEGDWGLDYLRLALGPDFAARMSRSPSRFEVLPGTNHLFSVVWSQERVLEIAREWHASVDWLPESG